jgi:hypothetical protein
MKMEDEVGGEIESNPEQSREPGQPLPARPEASLRLSGAQLRAAESVLDSYVRRSQPQGEPPSV